MATFLNSFEKRAICIPLIQRDYVQSLSTTIIESFVEQLIDVLSDVSATKSMNLNYIYGVDHPKLTTAEFEPVDGQQRLTTLWLFCLYISKYLKLNNNEASFDVRLVYQSREYANAFCQELMKHTAWAKNTDDFEIQIENQTWFIPDWGKDTSVIAMTKALAVIARKLSRLDSEKVIQIWARLNHAECPVTFSFYPTDTLGDDIYIKMNGRGRSLTTFENLKSWLDEKLYYYLPEKNYSSVNQEGVSQYFVRNWKYEMDNAWTNLFWDNRETDSYEIDDMQLRLFYNLLYLYWCFEDKTQILPSECDVDELAILLNLDTEDTNREKVTDAILSKIIKSSNYSIPLYILDNINLCPLKFFLWFYKVLNGLCAINNELKGITDKDIFFWGKSIDEDSGISRTLLFQIMMSESSQEEVSMSKLALSYAICKFACFYDKTVTRLIDWLYRCRNLILNNDFRNRNFNKALQSISSLFEECMKVTIDNVLKQENFKLNQFPEKYILLEQYKSEIITSGNNELVVAMKKLENKRFFVGSIICLPLLISVKDAIGNPSKFIRICDILSCIINGDGPKYEDKFRRALLYFSDPSYGFGGREGSLWSFLNGKTDWQWFFNDTESNEKVKLSNRKALKGVIDYLLLSQSNDYKGYIDNLVSLNSRVLDKYPVLSSNDWRYPFVYNDKVFKFMVAKCCRITLPYNIVLSTSTVIRTNSDHVSLQTFLLYRDYEDGHLSLGDGWKTELYKRENSCAVFKKDFLRITVEFMSSKNKMDAFSMRIYNAESETQDIGIQPLNKVANNLSAGHYDFTTQDGIRINDLSYDQVTNYLTDLMGLEIGSI